MGDKLGPMPARLVAVEDDWHEWCDDTPVAPSELPRVLVRVGEGDDGRLHLVGMHVDGLLSAEALRSIPVGRIEAAANAQFHPSASVLDGEEESYVIATPGDRGPLPPLPPHLWRDVSGGYPDSFYGAVAAIYRKLAAASPRPVVEIAGANDVPVTTAQRWVKEARRRGLLAPGRAGKAG
jgi:hypothetical protein